MGRPKKRTLVEVRKTAIEQATQRIIDGEYITAEKLALEFERSTATTALWLREAKAKAEEKLGEDGIENITPQSWSLAKERMVTRALGRLQRLERLADSEIRQKNGAEGLKLTEGCLKLMAQIGPLMEDLRRGSSNDGTQPTQAPDSSPSGLQFSL